jgi:chromosome segregation and condensation protein ScpB
MAKDDADQALDRELEDLPQDLRWREWMRRIEAMLFASASPVPREDLARVVGQGVSVDLLIDDLLADLEGRSFELAKVASGWMLRSRPAYATVIRTAADVGDQDLDLREYDVAVLAAIAYHQPITREGLKDIFGKEISRDLIGRLHARGLIGTGPRSP